MITEIVMPKMGESINEGTILEWRKKVGDTIELDEIPLRLVQIRLIQRYHLHARVSL